MNKKKVTYIFGSGRLTKIENNKNLQKKCIMAILH